MNRLKTYVTVALLLLCLSGIAQTSNNTLNRVGDKLHPKRLFIGDKVNLGSIELNNVRNYPGGKVKLSDFKGKFIILDFWTKSCGVCIAAFPKMERLQEQFKNDIQILLVTKNNEDELSLLLKKSPNIKNTKLPLVIGEQVLTKELFPHGSVPFHVWLDREGRVIATTYNEETNARNLDALIKGNPLNLLVKNEIFNADLQKDIENSKLSLLKIDGGDFKKHIKYSAQIPIPKNIRTVIDSSVQPPHSPFYYSIFMSYIPGDLRTPSQVLKQAILYDEKNVPKGFRIFNWDLNRLCREAFVDEGVEIVKVIAEDENAKLYYERTAIHNNGRGILQSNSYSYESFLPSYSFETAKRLLQLDLERFLGIVGIVEERSLKYFVLVRLDSAKEHNLWAKDQTTPLDIQRENRKTSEGYLIKNTAFYEVFSTLRANNNGIEDPIILDGTNFTNTEKSRKKVDVLLNCDSLKCSDENIRKIKDELAKYGLGLKEEFRKAKVLVLKTTI